jgi:nucleoid-associated protein YgaU
MDVARRIYGDEELARRLWLLNRDQVDRIDTALTSDLVLREP